MAILKKTWKTQVLSAGNRQQLYSTLNSVHNQQLGNLLSAIDTYFESKTGVAGTGNKYSLSSLYDVVMTMYLGGNSQQIQPTQTSLWDDMVLFVSSFKESDIRVFYEIRNNLFEYLGFYKKMLTNDGVARKIANHREYSDSRDSDGKNQGLNSVTPQNTALYNSTTQKIDNALFEQAIADYASDISQDASVKHDEGEGESDSETSGYSWEEALKNVRLTFHNELTKYISSIPYLIYQYYSLETMPFPEIVKQYYDNIKGLFESYQNE